MTRIGLISDTHGYIDESILRHFQNCDVILHAGDFGNGTVADKLKAMKPLMGVYGNVDGQDIRSDFPEVSKFSIEDVKVLMIHIGGYPGKYSLLARQEIALYKPGIFISGHSHILKIMYDDKWNCLHMNPGAAGKQGWQKVRTLIRFVIDGANIKDCEVIELGVL